MCENRHSSVAALDPQMRDIFFSEVAHVLLSIETMLQQPTCDWQLRSVFRVTHNMTGAAQLLDVSEVWLPTHALETLLVAMLASDRQPTQKEQVLLQQGYDLVRCSFDAWRANELVPPPQSYKDRVEKYIDSLKSMDTAKQAHCDTEMNQSGQQEESQ